MITYSYRVVQGELLQIAEEMYEAQYENEDENLKKVLTGATMMIYNHLGRWRQLLSMWDAHMRSLHIAAQRHRLNSSQYCLPRKSQLVLHHVQTNQLDFHTNFRVKKQTFEALCRLLASDKEHGWPESLEVLVFLNWLTSGASYRQVGIKFGLPKSTLCDIINRVFTKLLQSLRRIVHLPGENELNRIGEGFMQLSGNEVFRQSAGAIDCFHVAIKPPRQLEQYYINEKLFYSIKCQMLVDHQGMIRDVFVGFPGSVSDAQVWSLSPLYSKGFFPPEGRFILCDNGYPTNMHPATLTPYQDPSKNPLHLEFNQAHRKAWKMVYKTIADIKTRWRRVFSHHLEASNRLAPKIIAACAIIHNIALSNGDRIVTNNDQMKISVDMVNQPKENREFRDVIAKKILAEKCTPTTIDHTYMGEDQPIFNIESDDIESM